MNCFDDFDTQIQSDERSEVSKEINLEEYNDCIGIDWYIMGIYANE